MELTALTAISPIDGRYRKQVQHLDEYFSEYALDEIQGTDRNRILVFP